MCVSQQQPADQRDGTEAFEWARNSRLPRYCQLAEGLLLLVRGKDRAEFECRRRARILDICSRRGHYDQILGYTCIKDYVGDVGCGVAVCSFVVIFDTENIREADKEQPHEQSRLKGIMAIAIDYNM